MVMSNTPYSILYYLTGENRGKILQGATCRTDVLRGAYDPQTIFQALFDDFISSYSPLSAEVGDSYVLAPASLLQDFGGIG